MPAPEEVALKPWRDAERAEPFLSDYFEAHAARGREGLKRMLADPVALLRAWQAILRLPVVEAAIGDSSEARIVRRGLFRTNPLARALVLGTTAVLEIPADPTQYLVGANESKRSLRTKVNRADRKGFTWDSPTSLEERRALLRASDAFERAHPDEYYRNAAPDIDYLAALPTWLVARDASGKPLLLGVVATDSGWAVLEYFKTLEYSDDARLARFWLSAKLVQRLSDLGVRHLADVLSPIGLAPGLRSFQRRLGYRLVRVRLTGPRPALPVRDRVPSL